MYHERNGAAQTAMNGRSENHSSGDPESTKVFFTEMGSLSVGLCQLRLSGRINRAIPPTLVIVCEQM